GPQLGDVSKLSAHDDAQCHTQSSPRSGSSPRAHHASLQDAKERTRPFFPSAFRPASTLTNRSQSARGPRFVDRKRSGHGAAGPPEPSSSSPSGPSTRIRSASAAGSSWMNLRPTSKRAGAPFSRASIQTTSAVYVTGGVSGRKNSIFRSSPTLSGSSL